MKCLVMMFIGRKTLIITYEYKIVERCSFYAMQGAVVMVVGDCWRFFTCDIMLVSARRCGIFLLSKRLIYVDGYIVLD
jgi:hypothetical protein